MKNPNELKQHYDKWEVIKDLIDQSIDIMPVSYTHLTLPTNREV